MKNLTTLGFALFLLFNGLLYSADTVPSLTVQPLPGIFRGENEQPLRKVQIGLVPAPEQPETVLITCTDKRLPTALTLFLKGAQTEIGIPVPAALSTQELTFEVLVKRDGKELRQQFTLQPEKKWEIHLIHQTHLDIGFTHIQTDILKRQVQSLRDALKYIDETKDYPDEAKFRFHPEGMWAVNQFLKEATPEEKAAFIRAAKNRDLHIDGMYAQAMTGMYNEEELFALFGDALRFCRENDIVLDSVMQTDVPGYTWGLVTAMAQNGIKYMTMGPNCGHRVGRLYAWDNKPFWWESPSGKERVLCWQLDTGYHQFHGKPLDYVFTRDDIFRILSGDDPIKREREDQRTFPFEDLVVIRYGVEGDNGRPSRVLSDTVKKWNETYLYPKIIISRNSDVMRLLEQRYGKQLPVVRGDYTPYWEDGSASTSEATSINRRAANKLIQAETLWAMFNPKGFPKADFDAAWTDMMMYDEHTWGAHNSISEPDSEFVKTQDEYKQEYARRGARETQALVSSVVSAAEHEKELWVNTLSRKRDGICFIGKVSKDFEGTQTVRVFKTADGKTIPVQYVADPDGLTCSMYADLSRGPTAPNIPAFGTLEVSLDKTAVFEKTGVFRINAETGDIRGRKIRLKIDKKNGTITSMKLPGSAHDFVEQNTEQNSDGNRGLNDYLYITGRDAEKNRQRIDMPTTPSAENVRFTVLADGPLVASVLVEIDSGVPNAESLKRQITVFEDNEKVRIVNVLDKKMERRPEGTFFGFPFNVPGGKWYIDTPWACVEVEKDQIPGANRNYYSVQRYCTLANENCGINWVTVDANMVQFAPILFTKPWGLENWRKQFEDGQPGGTLYSWVCNNHWETNYKAGQEGRLTFEYWIWAYEKAAFNNGIAQRFARQVHQPILQFKGTATSTMPWTFTNEGSVITTSVKPVRDKSAALLVRLFNPTREIQETEFTLSEPYKGVFLSNPLEERGEPVKTLKLNPQETVTLRIE